MPSIRSCSALGSAHEGSLNLVNVALDPDIAALHQDALYLDAAVPLVNPRLCQSICRICGRVGSTPF